MHQTLLSKLVCHLLSQEDMKEFRRSLLLINNNCTPEDNQVKDDALEAIFLKEKQPLIDCKTEPIMKFMKRIYNGFLEEFKKQPFTKPMENGNRSWHLVKHLYNNILLLKNNYRHAIDITDYVNYCHSLTSTNNGPGCWCWVFWDEYRQDLLIVKLSKDPREENPAYEYNDRELRINFDTSLVPRYDKNFFPIKSAYLRAKGDWFQDIYIEKYFEIENYPLDKILPNVEEMRMITKQILTHPELMEERLKLFLYEEHRELLSTSRDKKKLDKELLIEIDKRVDALSDIHFSRSLVDLYKQTYLNLTRIESMNMSIEIDRAFSENQVCELLTSFIQKQFDHRVGEIVAVDLSDMMGKFIEDDDLESDLMYGWLVNTVRPDITWLFFDHGKREVILFSFGGFPRAHWDF